ncbi:MAG TPA: VOC family protein, partial [Hydrogenophaga sp.]|nr:VOC family protein [Hydrogenophaga sp.]
MTAQVDHLVVAAATLEEGVAWCEATLGVPPGPGGEHALFGTHNRLLKLHSDALPPIYLEIIAINPQAQPTRAADLRRWFDLDDTALRQRLLRHGPQLVHWVARVPAIEPAVAALQALGIDRGQVLQASRPTPRGLLQWR